MVMTLSNSFLDTKIPRVTEGIPILSTFEEARHILFVDTQVSNHLELAEGSLAGTQVFLLDPQQNGIEKITEILNYYPHFSTVHIVSHGSPGCLFLGNSQLSLATLNCYAEHLQSWCSRGAITNETINLPGQKSYDRTLILYGCNVAAGDAGAEFIEKLQQLTQARIAASTTRIGHATQGGNWNLEIRTHDFEIPRIFTSATQQNWPGVLADISGQAFLDFNNNGAVDGAAGNAANEADTGVANITVTAFGPDGTQLDQGTTDAAGNYTLTVPDDTDIRLEFTNVPEQFSNGDLAGASPDTVSNITFIDVGSTNVTANLSLYRPIDYLDRGTTPTLITTCYVDSSFEGNPFFVETDPAIVSVAYDDTDEAVGTPPDTKATLATIGEVGAVYGLAHHRQADDLFVGAFQRRHTNVGGTVAAGDLNGNDNIYRVDRDNGNALSVFIQLDDFFGPDSAGAYSHDATNFSADAVAFDATTKVALGDVEISEDRQFIWTVNLADRRLYKLPVGTTADPTTPVDYAPGDSRTIERYNLVDGINGEAGIDFSATAVPDDVRPFALAVRDGLVYVGFVDSAESTQNPDDLEAYVYTFDPETETFSNAPVIQFDLDYAREQKITFLTAPGGTSEWDPWVVQFSDFTLDVATGDQQWIQCH